MPGVPGAFPVSSLKRRDKLNCTIQDEAGTRTGVAASLGLTTQQDARDAQNAGLAASALLRVNTGSVYGCAHPLRPRPRQIPRRKRAIDGRACGETGADMMTHRGQDAETCGAGAMVERDRPTSAAILRRHAGVQAKASYPAPFPSAPSSGATSYIARYKTRPGHAQVLRPRLA